MPRYVLTGGTYAFIHGNRVNVGEVFELPEGMKPPKFSKLLEETEAPPVVETPQEEGLTTMHEMQVAGRTAVRASDDEPFKE
jgi:hypothetical protein